VIEITEHARVDNYDELTYALDNLRAHGARIAVDDAGAGYASLQHILRLRPEIIKLDLTITRNVDSDPIRRALTAALVGFAREIGASIVAEGIETADEVNTLKHLGVPSGQGYHLGYPAPIDALANAHPPSLRGI
jgi:EAL domain-containing protein (putative c-di-GMP-specific phosphodiesterase class I)